MKKFLESKVKEFFLLLIPLGMIFISIVPSIYFFYTDSIWWRVHAFMFISGIGLLAYLKSHWEFRNQLIEKFTDMVMTIITGFAFACFLAGCVSIFLVPMSIFSLFKKTEKYTYFLMRLISKTICFLIGARIIESGEKPQEKGLIYTPNHEGSLDYIPANFYAGAGLWKVVAGENLLKQLFFSVFAWMTCVFVERDDKKVSVFLKYVRKFFKVIKRNKIVELGGFFLKQGYSMVFYFEGTRKRESVPTPLIPFEKIQLGAFIMSIRYNVDIVPVVLIGTGRFKPPWKGDPVERKWYEKQWWSSPSKIYIHYLPKVSPVDAQGKTKGTRDLAREVYDAIESYKIQNEQRYILN